MVKEFKEFALRGNVMDLAVGVIIGAAFGRIVDSIVNDLIMPVAGIAIGGIDLSGYYLPLSGQQMGLPLEAARKAGAVFAYGNFITIVINFLILAFVVFMIVKQMNRLRRQAPSEAKTETPGEIVLLRDIRDSLKR